jgi:hypothetical protein
MTEVMTGAAIAATLVSTTANPAARAATRSLVMEIPCGRLDGFGTIVRLKAMRWYYPIGVFCLS